MEILYTNRVVTLAGRPRAAHWTYFAKTGNPNGADLPRFDLSSHQFIEFTDAGPVAKENLRRPQCDVFVENLARSSSWW